MDTSLSVTLPVLVPVKRKVMLSPASAAPLTSPVFSSSTPAAGGSGVVSSAGGVRTGGSCGLGGVPSAVAVLCTTPASGVYQGCWTVLMREDRGHGRYIQAQVQRAVQGRGGAVGHPVRPHDRPGGRGVRHQ